jgi:hypothetical protein
MEKLSRCQRGVLLVEYLVLTGVVGILAAASMYALGLPLLRFFRFAQFVLLSPVS